MADKRCLNKIQLPFFSHLVSNTLLKLIFWTVWKKKKRKISQKFKLSLVCIWGKGNREFVTEISVTTVILCFPFCLLYHWKLFKEYKENNIPLHNYSRECCSQLTIPPVMGQRGNLPSFFPVRYQNKGREQFFPSCPHVLLIIDLSRAAKVSKLT